MSLNISEYGYIRVATCAPELKIADVDYNVDKMIDAAKEALSNSCAFILFPELSVSGYSCGDIFFEKKLQNSSIDGLKKLASYSQYNNIIIVTGVLIENYGKLFNCAAVISNGKINGIVPKTFLCNSNQYYEERWFSSENDRINDTIRISGCDIPFGADVMFDVSSVPGLRFGIEICEDMWAIKPPSLDLCSAGANLIFNLSASDEYIGKFANRRNIVNAQSQRCMGAYVYASCGINESSSELVYSGDCFVSELGTTIAQNERYSFDSQLTMADIDLEKITAQRCNNNTFGSATPDKAYRLVDLAIEEKETNRLLSTYSKIPFLPAHHEDADFYCREIYSLQVAGLAKRLKHINGTKVVLGISGGLDSTLALIACAKTFDKLGLDRKGIIAISMPGFGTSSRTKNNADELAKLFGVTFREIPINSTVEAHFKDIDHNPEEKNIVYENAQARYRTQVLMDVGNQHAAVVIGTGDMSEIALGWCTYNGDHMSMYAVNPGIPKTLVRFLVEWSAEKDFNIETGKILKDIVLTPVSPELLPTKNSGEIAQVTEDVIGPYILHDFVLYHMLSNHFSPSKIFFIARNTFDEYSEGMILTTMKKFYKRFFTQQFKRSSMPDGVRVLRVALSPKADWRMPSDASFTLWINELDNIKYSM